MQLKGENANLKARLSDAATDREKQEMNGKKRKNLVVDNQALSSKLQAKTASHGRLQSELVQMTSRWKSLEQQVTRQLPPFCFVALNQMKMHLNEATKLLLTLFMHHCDACFLLPQTRESYLFCLAGMLQLCIL